jgi:hypothetical protein
MIGCIRETKEMLHFCDIRVDIARRSVDGLHGSRHADQSFGAMRTHTATDRAGG